LKSDKVVKQLVAQPDYDVKKIDIKFIVNGIDFPVIEAVYDMEKQIEWMVDKKAKEIVNDKLGDVFNKLSDFQNNVEKSVTKELSSKLGIELEDEERE
jgi:hypothetical protein